MKKIAVLLFASIALLPAMASAGKTTYVATNHRFNYVKLKEVGGRLAEERLMTHPVIINEQGLRTALASIKLERGSLFKKEAETREVFDDDAINFLAPNFVRAFKQATPMEEVVFSYLSKNPLFIIRNDRINIGHAWIHEDELHISFEKIFAKITGDVDKRGNEARAIARSMGVRVKLEVGPGQQIGQEKYEIVLNLHHNYAEETKVEEAPLVDVTMAGDQIRKGESKGTEVSQTGAKAAPARARQIVKKEESAPGTADSAEAQTTKGRLETLEQLKRDGLISDKEYKAKRKEILKDI